MRRTPTLTKECQRLFEKMRYGKTTPLWCSTAEIAEVTGLTNDQVRDAIWGPGADAWRQEMYARHTYRSS